MVLLLLWDVDHHMPKCIFGVFKSILETCGEWRLDLKHPLPVFFNFIASVREYFACVFSTYRTQQGNLGVGSLHFGIAPLTDAFVLARKEHVSACSLSTSQAQLISA